MSGYVLIDLPTPYDPLEELESFLKYLMEMPEEQRYNPEVIEAIRELEKMIAERKTHNI